MFPYNKVYLNSQYANMEDMMVCFNKEKRSRRPRFRNR